MNAQHPEGYCWWCGYWQVLPFLGAVCRACHESLGQISAEPVGRQAATRKKTSKR